MISFRPLTRCVDEFAHVRVQPVCIQIVSGDRSSDNFNEPISVERIGVMLHYAVVCFVGAVLAAMFGFSGIPVVAAEIAKGVCFMFIALFLVTLTAGVLRRQHWMHFRRTPGHDS